MGRTFACPECGNALELKGRESVRVVRCPWCRTLVEVPFFPRAARGRGSHGGIQAARWSALAWLVIGILTVLVVVLGTVVTVVSRTRSLNNRQLAALSASAEAYASQGQLDRALGQIEAAVSLARRLDPKGSARLSELSNRRDGIARKRAEAELASLDDLDPQTTLGRGLKLLSRAESDPAVGPLEPAIRLRLDELREKCIAVDASEAHRAFAADRLAEAFTLCERVAKTADDLPAARRRPIQDDVEALALRVVTHGGVIVAPVRGQFTFGSPNSYAKALRVPLGESLAQCGYIPRRASSRWRTLWDEHAPYRLTIEVTERFGTFYLQSKNRTSLLEVRFTLSRGGEPSLAQILLNVRTTVPLRGQSAFQASRLEVDDHRVATFEQVLYEDAWSRLAEGAVLRLRALPRLDPPPEEPRAPAAQPGDTASNPGAAAGPPAAR